MPVLEARGCPASETQVERWCYWRQGGLIERPVKHGKGRGSTSEFRNLEHTVDQVIETHAQVGRRGSLDAAALILCGRGRNLLPSDVKEAAVAVLDRFELDFRKDTFRGDASEDPIVLANNAGFALRRRLARERTPAERQKKNRELRAWEPALAIAALILLGEAITERQVSILLTDTEIQTLATRFDPAVTAASLAAFIQTAPTVVSIAAIRTALQQQQPVEIVRALQLSFGLRTIFLPNGAVFLDADPELLALACSYGLLARKGLSTSSDNR